MVSKMINSYHLWNNKTTVWFIGVIVASIVFRVVFLLSTSYVTATDSEAYIDFAKQIAQHNLTQDNGFRTPGYPIFMALFANNLNLVRIAQMALGILITAILFMIVWTLTHNTLLPVLAAASYGLNLSLITYENTILTETLATFLVVLSVALFIFILEKIVSRRSILVELLVLGGVSAFVALVRPLFLFLSPLYGIIILVKLLQENYQRRRLLLFVFFVPFILLVGGWSTYNYMRFGYWGPSTGTGYSLADHSIRYIQYAPDQFAIIRDIYLAVGKQLGTTNLNVWSGDAINRVLRKTGWSFSQLSRELTQMSIYLFVHHPFLYLRNVFWGWVHFWNTASPMVASTGGKSLFITASKNNLLKVLNIYEHIERYGTILIFNVPFLLLVGAILIRGLFKHGPKNIGISLSVLLMIIVVLITSITQAMMEYGMDYNNAERYALPVRGLIVSVVLIELWQIYRQVLGNVKGIKS